jgi:O-acetyl-ADP-ribose deacetylase (regulator of RNase III)
MTPLKDLFLIDRNTALVKAWQQAFSGFPEVKPIQGDYFSVSADAMVSPANSFGIMDGGLDLAIRGELGTSVQRVLQDRIQVAHHGELPVGSAEIVPTQSERWPFLIAAPTMRVPEDIAQTLNCYLAFRAVLLAIRKHNASSPSAQILSIICSGLGTGIGNVPPRKCASQMRIAYLQIGGDGVIPSFERIHDLHAQMHKVL